MSKMLNMVEIIRFAIEIEKSGYNFYVTSLKQIQKPEVTQLFQYLADEEFKHENLFRELLKKAGTFTPPESYPGEYNTYMKDFIESNLFASFKGKGKSQRAIENLHEALDRALEFERDSIVFYTAMKRYLAGENAELIETVIQEELNHIFRINQYQAEHERII